MVAREPEVVPDDDVPRAQRVHQHLVDEIFCDIDAHAFVEAQAHEAIDAVATPALRISRESASVAPAAHPSQSTRAASARTTAPTAGARAIRGALRSDPDHLLMTPMNAVEGADRQHATPMPRTQVMQAPNELHRGPRSSKLEGGHYRGRECRVRGPSHLLTAGASIRNCLTRTPRANSAPK